MDTIDYFCRFASAKNDRGDIVTVWSGDGPRVAAAMFAASQCLRCWSTVVVQVRRDGAKRWSKPMKVTITVEPG